jgi:N-glycosidase YbiA
MTIKFFSPRDLPYGAFSNFARYAFIVEAEVFRTSEHFYQAQKFIFSPSAYTQIVFASTPKEAATLGRTLAPLRDDWEQVKIKCMKWALFHKFTAHQSLRDLLVDTGTEQIVENSPYDLYWGIGRDGTGLNMLGKLLMQLRTHFQMQDR